MCATGPDGSKPYPTRAWTEYLHRNTSINSGGTFTAFLIVFLFGPNYIFPGLFSNQSHECFNWGMSVNMIHCCLQCSWVKDEQKPCIIQSDTVLWHIGRGNWSQSRLKGRAGRPPGDTEAGAHRGIAVNTSLDLNSFPTKNQFMWQGPKSEFSFAAYQVAPRRPVSDAADQHTLMGKRWGNINSLNAGWQLLLTWPNSMFI